MYTEKTYRKKLENFTNKKYLASFLVLLSALTIASMMSAFKISSQYLSFYQIIFIKSIGSTLLLLPIFIFSGIKFLPENGYHLYFLRIFLIIGAIVCWIYSIVNLPMGTATAISFSKSFFVLWLAYLFLSENITFQKILVTFIGFLGVLLCLEFTNSSILISGFVGIIGAVFAAGLTIVIKKLSIKEPVLRIMLIPNIAITLLFLLPALYSWNEIPTSIFLPVLIMITFGSISQWCFLTAYKLVDVSYIAPWEYSRLVAAIIFGFIFFNELLTINIIVGIILIIGSTYYSLLYIKSEDSYSIETRN